MLRVMVSPVKAPSTMRRLFWPWRLLLVPFQPSMGTVDMVATMVVMEDMVFTEDTT